MFNMKKFSDYFSAKRREKNITQEELANRIGVTHQAVSKWERGESVPEISKIRDISDVLDVPVGEMISAMHDATGDEKEYLDDEYYALPDKTLMGDVYALAPYLSRGVLVTAIYEITVAKGSAMAKMLFRYADEAQLAEVARLAFESDTDKGRADLLPYLPQDMLTKLILNRMSLGDINGVACILAYSKNPEIVGGAMDWIINECGNWNPMKSYVAGYLPGVVIEKGVEYAVKNHIGCFANWFGILGMDITTGIVTGYMNAFGNNLLSVQHCVPYFGACNPAKLGEYLNPVAETLPENVLSLVYEQLTDKEVTEKLAGKVDDFRTLKADKEERAARLVNLRSGGGGGYSQCYQYYGGSGDEAALTAMSSLLGDLSSQLGDMMSRLDDLDGRLHHLEDRLDDLEGRLDDLEG